MIAPANQSPGTGFPDRFLIDCLQYCRWSRKVFDQMRAGGVDAVHATVAYHGTFPEAVANISDWNRLFEEHSDLIVPGRSSRDVVAARDSGRTAVFLGFQNPSPIGDDLGLVEECHRLGIRFMQLTYNNQSLLGSGYQESADTGVTRMGREVIQEMNRLGIVVDMSHSGERSTLEAIAHSQQPVAVTHANPDRWHPTPRSKSHAVMTALAQSGGMIGFSLYPLHLRGGSDCPVAEFCSMIAGAAERYGVDCLGLGSDLCQDQPASQLTWMRRGRWMRISDDADDRAEGFPRQPDWFRDNRDFGNIEAGLQGTGFNAREIAAIMGGNWFRYFDAVFKPRSGPV